MTPQLKAKWIEALRSGEYKQTTGILRYVDNGEESFCCMGVLCEVVGVPRASVGYSFDGGLYEVAGLPASMLPRERQAHLVTMNDHEEKTFSEIADWIETHPF